MESLLYRYRNITVLLVVLCAQLVLLAWQVKNDKDVPLLRVWAVTAVTPVASAIEEVRHGTSGFFSNLFDRSNNGDQSRNLRAEMDRLRLQNQLLQNELESAQRVGAMAGFQARTPSKLKGARVIGGMGSRSILLDQGTTAGIRKGMAVVTPDGIVGRLIHCENIIAIGLNRRHSVRQRLLRERLRSRLFRRRHADRPAVVQAAENNRCF